MIMLSGYMQIFTILATSSLRRWTGLGWFEPYQAVSAFVISEFCLGGEGGLQHDKAAGYMSLTRNPNSCKMKNAISIKGSRKSSCTLA